MLIVAALLLLPLGRSAAAAERPEHQSKSAQKLIATLESVGINRSEIKHFIQQTDTHVSHGYFYLTEKKVPGGKLSLRYVLSSHDMGPTYSSRRLELHYSLTGNDRFHVIARTNVVLFRYHYNIPVLR